MTQKDRGTTNRPSFAWIRATPARFIAFGFGSGALYPGPGTWGTLLAWLIWWPIGPHLNDWFVAIFLLLAFIAGCWVCQRTGQELGVPDHSGMNWDEAVAFWLVLWLIPDSLVSQFLGFAFFRFFDIVKPAPVSYFDQRFQGGFGVMLDDIIAALYTLLVMAILVRLEIL